MKDIAMALAAAALTVCAFGQEVEAEASTDQGSAATERVGYWTPVKHTPQSGEQIVIDDQLFLIVSMADWERITNSVAKLQMVAERRWTKEHKTDQGRRDWHGNVTKTEITGTEKVTTYQDGFTWTEKMAKQTVRPPVAGGSSAGSSGKAARKPVTALPPRLARKREELLGVAPVTVSARFRAGGKVESVDGKAVAK